ncbi:COP9 signalosome complex subunit 7b-like [Convolutriloba macropyga]|uniref:COP9 signalosome complex subunit 7b-like n=1 Tax=Convolutriloba macropyga TaxID=536237 RepID=UPI003F51ECF9
MTAETAFNNPHLERFRIMSKSHKGEALVAMIKQALTSPQIFVYGEILSLPNIVDLKSGNHASLYQLLNVFAYGRLSDYDSSKHPQLEPAAYRKLQCLTLVSLANETKSISYDQLFTELKISNVRELEDLIIDAIYYGLIKGKMDQKNRILLVQSAVSRDIKGEEEMTNMVDVLTKWSENCQSVLGSVESQVELTKTHLEDLYNHRVKIESEVISTRHALAQDEQNKHARAAETGVADSHTTTKPKGGGGEKKYPKIKAAFGGSSSKTPSKSK